MLYNLQNKVSKPLNMILCGLYLYNIGRLLFSYFFIDAKWTRVFSLIGVCLVVWGFIKSKKSIKGCDSVCIPFYLFFISICIINTIIGIIQSFFSGRLNELITDQQLMWMYLVGLAFLIPVKFFNIRLFIQWALLYVLTSLIFSLFFFEDFFVNADIIIHSMISWDAYIVNRPQEPTFLLIPIAAFFIFFKRFSIQWRIIIVVAVILALLASIMAGRRTVSVMLLGYILIALYLYVIRAHSRWINVMIMVLFGGILFIQYGGVASMNRVLEKNFVIMSERVDADTRTAVEEDFYKSMNEASDWIIGRGMTGKYKSVQLSNIASLYRGIVETGYLNIILHGGLLMLIPYVFLLLFAFIKGFFFSNNYFLKSCALFVLYHFFLLYPSGHLRLTFEIFLLFVFIRICLSSKWRQLNNNDIYRKMSFPINNIFKLN